MRKRKPTYQELEKRLAIAEPIVQALKREEVDAVVGEEKIAFLLLRKVEEAWLESHGEFSAMFELDGIGMIQAEAPAFRFTRVNPKFCAIMGYSADELLTKSYLDLTHPQDRKRDLKVVGQVLVGKTDSWSNEKRCIRKDGGVVWVGVHGFALRDHSGRAVRIVAMIEDVTSRKQAEQQQRDDQSQLKTQLLAWTAEMSQMLRALRGQVAKRKLADQVLRAIKAFSDRSIGSVGGKASTGSSKPKRPKKSSIKKERKSKGRPSSEKLKRPSRRSR